MTAKLLPSLWLTRDDNILCKLSLKQCIRLLLPKPPLSYDSKTFVITGIQTQDDNILYKLSLKQHLRLLLSHHLHMTAKHLPSLGFKPKMTTSYSNCLWRYATAYIELGHTHGSLRIILITYVMGSGCGSVGRVVASDTRGLRFKSNHCQKYFWTSLLSTVLKSQK